MKKVFKNYLALLLCFIMFFAVGCGKSSESSTDTKSDTSVSKKDNLENNHKETKVEEKNEEKGKENKNSNNSNKELTKESVKKEENKKGSKDKDTNLNKNAKDNSKNNNSNSNKSSSASQSNDTELKGTSNSSGNKGEVTTKDNSSKSKKPVNPAKKPDETFTLVISKNTKSYTGGNPQVLLKKQLKIQSGKSLMSYLRENSSVIDEGGFIKSINGTRSLYPIPNSKKTADQKKNGIMGIDWFIYSNGSKISVGANDLYPKNGDVILFDFHEWNKGEFSVNRFLNEYYIA
ncbi:DUF4430 domain-containing protein [Hathewaya histolytica]|uniref:Transcobalamin-like C-terminal domain-containing protein n=1 Tax=Hathewaya histolytica TaxID=1498 RepID=A0A4V6KE81_HATHI|nr:DUF4430 domain-containing protein [Hathewaya histolytica]VTQ91037.1 Uncharacterised protein [Hathewaya histolytica]